MTTVYWKNERMVSARVEVRKWMAAVAAVREKLAAVVGVGKRLVVLLRRGNGW